MAGNRRRRIHTVDSHTEGNPTRVIVGGVRPPPGETIFEKLAWLEENDDSLRKLLVHEPRGGGLMCAVLLMPSISETADFSVLIMEQEGFVPMSGHCIIGTAMTVIETGMVDMIEPQTTVRFDTPAGLVTCYVDVVDGEVDAVSFENVASFLDRKNATIHTALSGTLSIDIAYGGDYYAMVDADTIGLELNPVNDARIIEAAVDIRRSVLEQLTVQHPVVPEINECYQVLFTSANHDNGDYKQTIVSPPGAVDRSPCGTGTCARLASLFANGMIGIGETRLFEGVLGTCFEGQVIEARNHQGRHFVTPRVRGRAHITGFHQFTLAAQDPFPAGFRMGPLPLK